MSINSEKNMDKKTEYYREWNRRQQWLVNLIGYDPLAESKRKEKEEKDLKLINEIVTPLYLQACHPDEYDSIPEERVWQNLKK